MSKIFKSLIDATNPAIKLSDFASKKSAPVKSGKSIDLVSVQKDSVKVVDPKNQPRDLVAESRVARKGFKLWG